MNKDIVFIPGALANSKLWHYQEIHFQHSKRFHHVNVLNSDSVLNMAQRFSLHSPKKFTLIGFSMGGYVALELYCTIPERIENLILINSAASVVSEKWILERARSIDLIDKGKFDLLIKLIFKNSIYDTRKHHVLLPLAETMAHEVGVENYKNQLNAILNKPDHSALLPNIDCPTLIIASKQDQVMPFDRSEYMAKKIKNAELIYLEECGHIAMLEQPDRINKILAGWL